MNAEKESYRAIFVRTLPPDANEMAELRRVFPEIQHRRVRMKMGDGGHQCSMFFQDEMTTTITNMIEEMGARGIDFFGLMTLDDLHEVLKSTRRYIASGRSPKQQQEVESSGVIRKYLSSHEK